MNELIIIGIILLALCLFYVVMTVMGALFGDESYLSKREKAVGVFALILVTVAVLGFMGTLYAYGKYMQEQEIKEPYYIEQPLKQRI